jgi:ADP-ribose pyrophosphatase YjhB (NUDIX family)
VETALVREFEEETSLAIRDRLLCTISDDTRTRPNGDHVHTLRIVFLVTVQPGEIRHEADGSTDLAEWVDLTDLEKRPLAPYAQCAIAIALDQLAVESRSGQETNSTLDRIREIAGVS